MVYEIINTSGLLLDIWGAYYLAHEVTNRFEGAKYEPGSVVCGGSTRPVNSADFDAWEIEHFKKMSRGLKLLGAGFILQITGVWHLEKYAAQLYTALFQG